MMQKDSNGQIGTWLRSLLPMLSICEYGVYTMVNRDLTTVVSSFISFMVIIVMHTRRKFWNDIFSRIIDFELVVCFCCLLQRFEEMMRQWVLIVVTLILVALTGRIMSEVDVDDGEPVNKDHFYIEVLHRALAESDKLNLTMAMAAATRFSNGSAHLQRLLLDRNIIHHTLDLYRLSQNNAERAYLVEILGILVEKGAAIREQDDEEPDVVTKSVFIREMVLANKLVHAGQLPLSLSSSLLRLLYMIPCDAVPLAKLLLHAHTIVLNVITAKGEFPDGVEGIKKFVNSAALQPGAKPAVKGSDLAAMSPTYSALLSRLGTQEQHDRGIYLSDIIDVLDETTSRLHDAFVSTPSVSKATTSSDSAGEAGDPRQVTVEMLSQTDNFGRNPLHILCLSGAKKLLTALLDHVGSLSSPASTSVTKALVKALTAKDARGQTPMTYLGEHHHYILYLRVPTSHPEHSNNLIT